MTTDHVRRCPSCDEPWTQATARFCGRCGAALPDAATDRTATNRMTTSEPGASAATSTSRQRLPWLGLGAIAVLVAIGVAVALDAGTIEEPTEDRSDPAVDLPEPEEVTEEPPNDTAAPDAAEDLAPVEVDCGTVDDCVLWRRGVEHAIVAVVDATIMVLEPPVPRSGTTRDARLSALSPETGDVLWERTLTIEVDAASGPQGLMPIDGESFVITLGSTLHLLHADGEWPWSLRFDRRVQGLQLGPDGDLIVALGEPAGPEGPVSEDEVHEVPASPDGPADVVLVRLDRRDGTERWRVGPVAPLAITATHAIVGREAGVAASLDLATGRLRDWPEATTALLPSDPRELGSRRLDVDDGSLRIIDDRDVVTVIDAVSGEVERTVQLDVPPAHQIELAGSLALVVEQVPPDQDDQRFTLRVHALSDPQEPLVSFDTASGLALLADRTDGRLGAPVTAFGHRPSPTDAVAVTEPHEGGARVTVLESDGSARFSRVVDTVGAVDGTCCASLRPGTDPRWLVLSQPTPEGRVTDLLRAEDGQVLRQITEEGPDAGGQLVGRTLLRGDAAGTRLWFSDTEVHVTARPWLVPGAPLPLLQTREGLIALDPEVVGAA